MLASLKPKGRMGVVLDQGALFRGGAEGSIREGVLEDDLVECVVALPEKIFFNTGAPGCLIFLNKNKPSERKRKVLFIYAAEGYEKLSNMNRLREENTQHIINTFETFMDVLKYARVAQLDEVKENYFNLSITRYVDIFDEPEQVDIAKVWAELRELENQREDTNQKLIRYMRELELE